MIAEIVEESIALVTSEWVTDPNDILLGGLVDSLGVYELLEALETRLKAETGYRPALLGNAALMRDGGPLSTVGSLIEYLEDETE